MPRPGPWTPDGRPAWLPAALRSWQSKRKIAGNRTPVRPGGCTTDMQHAVPAGRPETAAGP